MLRRNWRRLCHFMICILFITGMYSTYMKADSIAEHAVAASIAQNVQLCTNGDVITQVERAQTSDVKTAWLQKNNSSVVQEAACVIRNVNPVIRAVIGRTMSHSNSLRRDLRLLTIFLWGICIAYFLLRVWRIEEILCLYEKKYRAALIKYIHDMDGKKRMSCLA